MPNIKSAEADVLLAQVRDWAKGKFQTLANIVTQWSASLSDTKYPSEKLVKESLDAKYAKPSGGIPATDLASGVQTSLSNADNAIAGVNSINGKIPSEASSSNKLADKDFVNSSIATNTAYFKGTLDAATDLGLTKPASHAAIVAALNAHTFSPAVTNNDYCFVVNQDEDSDVIYDRFKYVSENSTWAYEYSLNNSSFTASQWATINSGVTSAKVANYDSHLERTDNPHSVTKAQVGLGNVPNTDFTSRVGALETAVQDKVTKNSPITGATKCKITYDAKGLVTGGSDLAASDLPNNYGDSKNPYANKTANYALMAPNGSAGAPIFRAVVTNDISDMEFMTAQEMLAILNA